jgi:hypothetical protein
MWHGFLGTTSLHRHVHGYYELYSVSAQSDTYTETAYSIWGMYSSDTRYAALGRGARSGTAGMRNHGGWPAQ